MAICAIWMLSTMVSARQSPERLRALQLALLVYLSIRGFFESGLLDASTAFILFFVIAMATPLKAATKPGLSGMRADEQETAHPSRPGAGRHGLGVV